MKNTILLFSILILFKQVILAQNIDTSGAFTLKGKVIGQNTGKIKLSYTNKNKQYLQDSMELKNGNFIFHGYISQPTLAFLEGNRKSRSVEDLNFTELFLENGEIEILLKINEFKNADVKGSFTQDEVEALNKQKQPVSNEMKPLNEAYHKTLQKYLDEKDETKKAIFGQETDSIRGLFAPFNVKLNKIAYAFMETHSDSYLSPYLMIYQVSELSLDSVKTVYNNWNNVIRQSRDGLIIGNEIKKIESNVVGKIAPDFTEIDYNGNTISLSALYGKNYVLLDFWASWCVPCRKANPHLIKLYNTYHSKGFEVIGVSADTDKNEWINAINKDSIAIWRHVLIAPDIIRNKQEKNYDNIGDKYRIDAYPTQILINKEGIIIGKWVGENNMDLDKLLAEIFK